MEIPTVRIKADNPLGYAIINEEDFNPDEHELFESEEMTGIPGQNDEEPELKLKTLEFETAQLINAEELTDQKPDETPPEPKQRKRRHSVES